MTKQAGKSVAVIGAGDHIGSAVAKRFAREGYTVFAGRRNGDKLKPLVDAVESEGGRIFARALDARKEDDITSFLREAESEAPLEVCVFNVGANVKYPLLETTERVFRKLWEMGCYAGFLAARESARLMLPRGSGSILLTGATASVRGAAGFSGFSAAKSGLRSVAESAAREMWPKGIHVAHLIVDAGVDTEWTRQLIASTEGQAALENIDPHRLMPPEIIAEIYWQLHRQPKGAWTFEQTVRPFKEHW